MFHGIRLARRRIQSKISLLLIFTFLVITLSACSSETTVTREGSCADTAAGGVLCLKLIDTETGKIIRNIKRNSTAQLVAILKDASNNGISGAVISFTAEFAELENDGKGLTDDNGEVAITITSGTSQKTGYATAAYTDEGTELTVSYGVTVEGSIDDSTTPTGKGSCQATQSGGILCLGLVDENGNLITKIVTDGSATFIATLKNGSNTGIANVSVNFSSSFGQFSADTAQTSSNGEASTSITANSDPGAATASVSFDDDGSNLSVSYNFTITEAEVVVDPSVSTSVTGAIEFVSATPSVIALRNTGGTGLTEFSTIQFKIVGTDGLPMANRLVNFSLNTDIGGIDIDPVSASTNSSGLVSTTLQSGSVPTSIRVTATSQVTDINGNTQTIFTQSDQLVVSTGIPDQDSMTLSLSSENPEAWDINGVEVDVTARLADHFNNMVPDGTAVYFTTEGGAIQPSCFTEDGACTVKWRSQDPRPADHRVTILATAIGNESFHDTDSDGKYSLADGEPYKDENGNFIYDEPFEDNNPQNGIFDEPFLNDFNGKWDVGEPFVDTMNGKYDPGESFTDLGNGQYDLGEVITNDVNGNGVYDAQEPYTDANGNLQYDLGEAFDDLNGNLVRDPGDTYTDVGNGVWDPGEPFVDAVNGVWDIGESFTDTREGIYEVGEWFLDYNGNGRYDGTAARNNPDGETKFTDSNNGNGLYDGAGTIPAGETYTDANGNGLFDGPGFADLPEPYLDANENGKYDIGERYVDTNNNGSIELVGDTKYNGILCIENNNCSSESTLHIRKLAILIMSSTNAFFTVTDSGNSSLIYATNDPRFSRNVNIDISSGRSIGLVLRVTDTAGQVMPEGTSITVTADGADISGGTMKVGSTIGSAYSLRNSDNSEKAQETGHLVPFRIKDADETTNEEGTLTITIETPSGFKTSSSIAFNT